MAFKVLFNGNQIDAIKDKIYVKYQKKHDTLLLCPVEEAEGILSGDGNSAYHTFECPNRFKTDKFKTVQLEEITDTEYRRLQALNGMTPEQIIDAYTLSLIEEGIL